MRKGNPIDSFALGVVFTMLIQFVMSNDIEMFPAHLNEAVDRCSNNGGVVSYVFTDGHVNALVTDIEATCGNGTTYVSTGLTRKEFITGKEK